MSTVRTANTSPNRKQIQPIKIISKVRVDAHNAPRVFLIGVPEFSNLFFLLTLTTVPATTKNKKKVKKKNENSEVIVLHRTQYAGRKKETANSDEKRRLDEQEAITCTTRHNFSRGIYPRRGTHSLSLRRW